MRLSAFVRFFLFIFLIGYFLITGCTVGKNPDQASLEQALSPKADEMDEDSLEIREVIQEAETHYDKGYEHYEQQNWALAQQEFDKALEILLDADVDAETHYRLGKTYDRLFYKIHKLELEESYLRGMVVEKEEIPEQAQTTDQLEASLSNVQPDFSASELTPQLDEDFSQSEEDTLGTIVIDPSDAEIMKYVKQFSRERSQSRKGLERSPHYLPMMEKIFNAHHLPPELIYLPLIESNYRVDAVSPAGAVGLWQFVLETARCYGLKVDKWIDERRDPEKSTKAAANYLEDLYDMLGDWDLALSGYYMGEYKVHKAIGQHRTRDISELAKTRSFGKSAKDYVSRFKAAVLLARNPEQYGITLDPEAEAPLSYDTVQVRQGVRLKDLAKEFGITDDELRKLNPELKQSKTPPGKGTYTLKVPVGAGVIAIAENLTEPEQTPVAPQKTTSTQAKVASSSEEQVVYRVRRGDTLLKIARLYGTDVNVLKQHNKIQNARFLQIGQKLLIPTSGTSYASAKDIKIIPHTVQKGETLSAIANRYKVDLATLKTHNKIKDERALQIGRTLNVPLSPSSVFASAREIKIITHTIQKGETLSAIAKRYKVDLATLKAHNKIKDERTLQIGQTLNVPLSPSSVFAQNQGSDSSQGKMFTYRVKRGDSLSKIASTFGVSVRQLQKWNDFGRGTLIYPGSRIKVWY